MSLGCFVITACLSCSRAEKTKQHASVDERLHEVLQLGRTLSAEATSKEVLTALREAHRARPVPQMFDLVVKDSDGAEPQTADPAANARKTEKQYENVKQPPPIDWNAGGDSNPRLHYLVNAWRPWNPDLSDYQRQASPKAIESVRAVVFDWIDQNITKNRKNSKKWYDMAAALRADKLGFVITDGLRNDAFSGEQLATLLEAAQAHGEFLSDPKNLARGNHTLYMMSGLASLCRSVPELAKCPQYVSYARKTLSRFLKEQFSKEGVHLEGAPSYHLLMMRVLSDLTKSQVFGAHGEIERVLKKSETFPSSSFHPNGDAVLVGDSDAKKISTFADLSPGLAFLSSDGKEGVAPTLSGVAFEDAGYFAFRSPWTQTPFKDHTYLFFSTGSQAVQHSHLDDFTFEWSELGQPIVVDSGRYSYKKDSWRDFFRSARAGNTIEIDGKDHSQQPTGSRLTAWGNSEGLYFAEAKVRRSESNVEHTRLLVGKPRTWLCVVDLLGAKQSHVYRQWFGMHPSLAVEQRERGFVVTGPEGLPKIEVVALGDAVVSTELEKGKSGKRPQGWVSRRYDQKEPRFSFAFKNESTNARLVSLFSLQGSPRKNTVGVSGNDLTVRWSTDSGEQGFRYVQGKLLPLDKK